MTGSPTTPPSEPGPPRDRRAAAREVGVDPSAPGEVLLRVQSACDQRCLFCSADPQREPSVRAPEQIAAAVRSQRGSPSVPIVLSGGEPTLGAALPAQVGAALGAGAPTVMIQTNGMRLTEPALLDGLAPFRDRVFFLVSLHSHRADVSDLLTRTRGGHARTLAGVDAALATGFRVWVNHVLTTLNVFDAEAFVQFVRQRFPDLSLLVVSTVNPTFRAAANPWLMAPLDAVRGPLLAALDAAREVGLAVAISEVCGVPLCVVPGHEASHDALAAAPELPVPELPVSELPVPGLPPGRVKGPQCASCRFDDRCLGVWAGYAERYGFRGLVPVATPDADGRPA